MNNEIKKTAIIIGAGPAGLTAALELLSRSHVRPVIFEKEDVVGGLSRTVSYRGNKIDIGPHRFFSKSERVMSMWLSILPLQGAPAEDDILLNRSILLSDTPDAPDPEKEDRVLLYKNRITRIFFLNKFFDYPVTLNCNTLTNLGPLRVLKIGASYALSRLFPIQDEKTLEDFFINRFGRQLFQTFFRDYTEKVWGVPCAKIPADWGGQRIKGLSVFEVIKHAAKKIFKRTPSLTQKDTQTSLVESFLFPKLGAGQMYEEMARQITEMGGTIHLRHQINAIQTNGHSIKSIQTSDLRTGDRQTFSGDYFFSSMPVKELISQLDGGVPEEVKSLADGLVYRDYILVGLLLKSMKLNNETNIRTLHRLIPDNWIYIQERNVKVGRLFFMNNLSLYTVKDRNLVWMGAEYFCTEGDDLWIKSDSDMARFAMDELATINILNPGNVMDHNVIRVRGAYPAYFGTYSRFNEIRSFVDQYENLFLIGRNGMHKYNNMDHSILTAMTAVDNLLAGRADKENIWKINTEDEYQEATS